MLWPRPVDGAPQVPMGMSYLASGQWHFWEDFRDSAVSGSELVAQSTADRQPPCAWSTQENRYKGGKQLELQTRESPSVRKHGAARH